MTKAAEEKEPEAIWADDLLGRKKDAIFLERFLTARILERQAAGKIGCYVLDIDANWGSGKTYFLDRFALQLARSGHLVATVNAWKVDHLDDPFIAIMAAIDTALEPFTIKRGKAASTWETVKASATPIAGRVIAGTVKTLIKRYTGSTVEALLGDGEVSESAENGPETASEKTLIDEAVESAEQVITVEVEKVIDQTAEHLIEKFRNQQEAVLDFRDKLEKALTTLGSVKKLPLFILVDELDRCRPSYAIALLERVKHLFDVENVVFVFATNSDQLQHSVSGAYGGGFDGFRYLKRFFDRTYVFEKPSLHKFVASLTISLTAEKVRTPFPTFLEFLVAGCEHYKMDLRESQHVIDIIQTVVSVWPFKVPIDLVLLFPLAATFYRTGSVDWETAGRDIPEDFLFRRRYERMRYDPEGRREITIEIKDAYRQATNAFGRMQNLMDFGNNEGASSTQMYVRETFTPEWNGLPINRDAPSVQKQLDSFVRSAGRLLIVDDDQR